MKQFTDAVLNTSDRLCASTRAQLTGSFTQQARRSYRRTYDSTDIIIHSECKRRFTIPNCDTHTTLNCATHETFHLNNTHSHMNIGSDATRLLCYVNSSFLSGLFDFIARWYSQHARCIRSDAVSETGTAFERHKSYAHYSLMDHWWIVQHWNKN